MNDLLDQHPLPVLTIHRDGRLAYANQAAAELGLRSGQSLDQVTDAHSARDILARLRRLEAGQREEVVIDVLVGDQPHTCQAVFQLRESPTDGPGDIAVHLRPESDEELAGRLLRRMVAHTTGAGQTYFEQLVVHLAAKLGTRWALIARIQDGDPTRLRTVACCQDGSLIQGAEFDVTDTPFASVMEGSPTVYPVAVSSLFDHDPRLVDWNVQSFAGVPLIGRHGHAIGAMVLMHDKPLVASANAIAFLNLFAGRTSTELERLNAQSEADRQRAFVERLLDRVGALVLLLDPDGNVVRSNRTVTLATGWKEQDLLDKPLWKTLAPPRAADTLYGMLRANTGAIEQDWLTPAGDPRRIRWEAQGVTDGGESKRPFILVTGMDLTTLQATREERDRLQERLRQARRLEALGRLAGGVAHDFNNLLLAILGYADLIEFESPEDSEAASFAREIRRAGDQAASLTRQLLAFGRRQRLERRKLDLRDVLDGATSILRPLLPDTITLDVQIQDGDLPVVADPGRLEQVLVNLGVNARDAMPQGGRVALRARRLKSDDIPQDLGPAAVAIEVSDTGTGIPAEVLPHIFEPFFTTKELGRGTGLGLASVYGTIQQHGGTLDVHTEEGSGTTFRILLPLDATTEPAASTQPDGSAGGTRGSVLVAEDDPHVRSLVQRILGTAGYDVHPFEDGQAAWEAWEQDPSRYDLVLADVLMPRLGGMDLAIRVLEAAPDTRVVLTSGFVAETERVPEGVHVLQKPYLPDDLLHEVGKAMAPSTV